MSNNQVTISTTHKNNVTKLISEITDQQIELYNKYWESITPKTVEQKIRRFAYAHMTVNVAWEASLNCYNLMLQAGDECLFDETELTQILIDSKVGMFNIRKRGISEQAIKLKTDPSIAELQATETWQVCRDRVRRESFGLGLAKSSFALEMCYPLTAEVVCIDTHMLQLFGTTNKEIAKDSMRESKYCEMESTWIHACKQRGVSSFVARNVFWDAKQNQKGCRYWSSPIEDEIEDKEQRESISRIFNTL